MNTPKEITIRPALNGYICQVGCQTVVFESRELLVKRLDDYLTEPAVVEKWFRDHATNKDLLKCPQPPQPVCEARQTECEPASLLGSPGQRTADH